MKDNNKTSIQEAFANILAQGFDQLAAAGLLAIYVLARRLGKEKELFEKDSQEAIEEYSTHSLTISKLQNHFEKMPDLDASFWEKTCSPFQHLTDDQILTAFLEEFPRKKTNSLLFPKELIQPTHDWVVQKTDEPILFVLEKFNDLPFQICGTKLLANCQVSEDFLLANTLFTIWPGQKIYLEEKKVDALGKVDRRYTSAVILPVDNSQYFPDDNIITNSLQSVSGRIALFVRTHFLSSLRISSSEIRQKLIESHRIHQIIELPRSALGEASATTLILLDEESKKHQDIEIYDFSQTKDLSLIFEGLKKGKIPEKTKASIEEIQKNNYILDLRRYFLTEKEKKALLELSENAIPLSDVAQFIRVQAFLKKTNLDKIDCLEIAVADIDDNGFVNYYQSKKVAVSDIHRQRYQVQQGDILIATRGASGRIGFIENTVDNLIASQTFIIIRSTDPQKYPPEYIFQCLQSETVKKYIESRVMGKSILSTLPMADIRGIPIQVVTEEKAQKALLRHQKKLKIIEKMDELAKKYQKELQKLQDEMKSLVV